MARYEMPDGMIVDTGNASAKWAEAADLGSSPAEIWMMMILSSREEVGDQVIE